MFSGLDAIDLRHGRRWTAMASFVLQGILVSAAVVLPLLNPARLPDALLRHPLLTPIAFHDRSITVTQQSPSSGTAHPPVIVVPSVFTFHRGGNSSATTSITESPVGPPSLNPSTPGDGSELPNLFPSGPVQPILRPVQKAKAPPVSVLMEGNLLHRVEPQYPTIAKQIRLHGTVLLRALVTAQGTVENIQVVSGPAILAQAARAAVKEWRYRPYNLNGTNIPVETEITVKFTLTQ